MSSIRKQLQIVLGVVLLLTSGAMSVTAQTPAATKTSTTKPVADAVSSNGPTDTPTTESQQPTAAPAENAAPRNISAKSRDLDNATSFEFPGASNANAKTAALPKSGLSRSPQAANADKWQFQFSPYFWLASLHGTAGVGNRTTNVQESFSDIFHSLKFALMGVLEARKNKVVVLTDLEYISIEDDRATPGPLFSNANAKFKTFIFDPEVGYRVFENAELGRSLDILGGVRVWHMSTDLSFGAGILPAQQLEGSRTWVDGVAGVRGKAALSKKAFVTAKADLGGGGSKFTYQLFGGAGFNVSPKIALIGGYRVLDVNYAKNNFVYNMNQRGPIFGLGFKF